MGEFRLLNICILVLGLMTCPGQARGFTCASTVMDYRAMELLHLQLKEDTNRVYNYRSLPTISQAYISFSSFRFLIFAKYMQSQYDLQWEHQEQLLLRIASPFQKLLNKTALSEPADVPLLTA